MCRRLLVAGVTTLVLVAGVAPAAAAAGDVDPACSSGQGAGALPVSSPLAALPRTDHRQPLWPRDDGGPPFGIALQPLPGTAADLAELTRFLTSEPYVRLQVAVNLIWPRPERELCLATVDRDYRDLVERGVRPLLLPSGLPFWMAAGRLGAACPEQAFNYCVSPPRDGALAEHARIFAVLAERYPLAAGLEAANEPNLRPFFGGIAPDPALYARGMRAAYTATKRANPRMRFIGLGIAPMPATSPDGISEIEFLDRAFVAGVGGAFDAISVHPYPRSGTERYMKNVDDVLRRFGHPRARFVVTETGVTTVPGDAANQIAAGTRILEQYDAFAPGGSAPGAGRVDGYLAYTAHQAVGSAFNMFDLGLFAPTWEPRRQACMIRQRFTGRADCGAIARQGGPSSPRRAAGS